MWTTTGPCGVNWTWRSYVTPGISETRPACAGAASAAKSRAVMAVLRSTGAPTLAHYGLGERSLYTLQKRFMRQTARIRSRALLLAVFVLVLGLGLGAYLATRDSEDTASREPVGSTATGPRPQPPPPPTVAGPHTRPVPILMYHVVGPTPPGAALPGLYVSSEDFAGQLRWLAGRGYHAVTL